MKNTAVEVDGTKYTFDPDRLKYKEAKRLKAKYFEQMKAKDGEPEIESMAGIMAVGDEMNESIIKICFLFDGDIDELTITKMAEFVEIIEGSKIVNFIMGGQSSAKAA